MANQLLLVDDSPLIHRVVELTFEGQDFAVHATEDAEEALALARTLKPDIVLASADLKGAGGLDICRRLRQEADLAGVPVLLLTGARGGLTEGEARKAGAAGVLAKPFEPERLLAEVNRVLASGAPQPAPPPPAGDAAAKEAPLFEDKDLEALFAGESEEQPAAMPGDVSEEEALLQQGEKLLEPVEPSAGAAPPGEAEASTPPPQPAAAGPPSEVDLFEDADLEGLFAEDLEEAAAPAAAAEEGPKTPPPEGGAEWAGAEEELIAEQVEAEGDIEDLADMQVNAAEAQLAELQAELAAGQESLTEEQMHAAEKELASLQEELAQELEAAGEEELTAGLEAPEEEAPEEEVSAAAPTIPAAAEEDADLLALAEEAGYGAASPEPPSTAAEDDVELEEVAAFAEEEADAPPEAQEAPAPAIPKEEVLRPRMEESLERTVEAIVPALIRNIESVILRQLPDLVEKIVLREIEKIKRGE